MIQDALKKLVNGKRLDYGEVQEVIGQITEGRATNSQIGAFLAALRLNGETVSDILAAVDVMKGKCIPVNLSSADVVDIVGTGGDCKGTFNITTAAAFCAASAGAKIAKTGNRSSSSKAGASDVIKALGAKIDLTPEQIAEVFEQTGICFMYAPNHHPCMKYVSDVRHEIGFRTIFNILGPLLNASNAKMQLIGVYDKKLLEPIADVLLKLGITGGMTYHGKDGLDEATITDYTYISEIKNGKILNYEISPLDFNLKRASMADIIGGNAVDNAKIIEDIFNGKDKGAKYDITALNAALILYVSGRVKNIKEGVELAKSAIDNGFAAKTLHKFVNLTNRF